MFADVKAVMWKEYLEIFWAKSDRAKALFKLLLFMTVVTVFFLSQLKMKIVVLLGLNYGA